MDNAGAHSPFARQHDSHRAGHDHNGVSKLGQSPCQRCPIHHPQEECARTLTPSQSPFSHTSSSSTATLPTPCSVAGTALFTTLPPRWCTENSTSTSTSPAPCTSLRAALTRIDRAAQATTPNSSSGPCSGKCAAPPATTNPSRSLPCGDPTPTDIVRNRSYADHVRVLRFRQPCPTHTPQAIDEATRALDRTEAWDLAASLLAHLPWVEDLTWETSLGVGEELWAVSSHITARTDSRRYLPSGTSAAWRLSRRSLIQRS